MSASSARSAGANAPALHERPRSYRVSIKAPSAPLRARPRARVAAAPSSLRPPSSRSSDAAPASSGEPSLSEICRPWHSPSAVARRTSSTRAASSVSLQERRAPGIGALPRSLVRATPGEGANAGDEPRQRRSRRRRRHPSGCRALHGRRRRGPRACGRSAAMACFTRLRARYGRRSSGPALGARRTGCRADPQKVRDAHRERLGMHRPFRRRRVPSDGKTLALVLAPPQPLRATARSDSAPSSSRSRPSTRRRSARSRGPSRCMPGRPGPRAPDRA